jgi:hypothetical protein
MIVAVTTASDVIVALIAAIPSILAAVFAGIVALRTRMPAGERLGQTVSEAHATVIDNQTLLVKMNGGGEKGDG